MLGEHAEAGPRGPSLEELVEALIDELELHERKAQMALLLTGFFDASGRLDSDYVVMSGAIVRADQVRAFTREWRKALRKPPGLGVFKSAQWRALVDGRLDDCGEFHPRKGWAKGLARQRVRELQSIIRAYVYAHLSVSVPMRRYRTIVRARVARYHDHPYQVAFPEMLRLVNAFGEAQQPERRIFLICDTDQRNEDAFTAQWRSIRKQRKHGRWIGSLAFHRDEDRVIIQASDLLAASMNWQLRFGDPRRRQQETFTRVRGMLFKGIVVDDALLWSWRKRDAAYRLGVGYHNVDKIVQS